MHLRPRIAQSADLMAKTAAPGIQKVFLPPKAGLAGVFGAGGRRTFTSKIKLPDGRGYVFYSRVKRGKPGVPVRQGRPDQDAHDGDGVVPAWLAIIHAVGQTESHIPGRTAETGMATSGCCSWRHTRDRNGSGARG